MKTIFITSFHQFISRNILHTPIVDGLLAIPDVRVVLVVPADKKAYFEHEFARDKVSIECVDTSRAANGFWSLLFKRAARAMGGFRYKEVARGFRVNRYRNLALTVFFYYPLRVLGRFGAAHTFMRFLDSRLVKNRATAALFEKYAPHLVFSTDAYNENDVIVAIEAKRREVRVVSMIRSWDNIEMYGLLRVIPETLSVWGDFLKQEILRLDAFDPVRITIVGVPHYDRYLKGPTTSRASFFHSIGADPHRKFILYTPVGDMYVKENDVDGVVLSELAKTGANILVRMPPADTVSFGNIDPPRNVFFYRPGTASKRTGRREISREDDEHLINSLYFSDLVVCGPSTIMLDAVLLDKPVVLFGFEKGGKDYHESVLSLYDSRHLRTVIDNGGARLAKSVSEFNAAITEYLLDPKKDAEGRRRAVEFVCFKTDGKSCERVLHVLQSALHESLAISHRS